MALLQLRYLLRPPIGVGQQSREADVMKLPDWWDDFCLVLFFLLFSYHSAYSSLLKRHHAAVPPDVARSADPAPIVYPDQLHPEDVWEMAEIRTLDEGRTRRGW